MAETKRWLEKAVIGLNLCPFAKAVHAKAQIHYAVSFATQWPELMEALKRELIDLVALNHQDRETTLLIAPACLDDFLDFNQFVQQANRTLKSLKLKGVIQLASFHPRFQFAGTLTDDIGNFTNRAPYPTVHLLREERVEQALASFAQPQSIYEANLQTLKQLGKVGWDSLNLGAGRGKR